MIADYHVQVVKARVRGRKRIRHAAKPFDRGRGWVFAEALGPPRLWAQALDEALNCFAASADNELHASGASLASCVTRVREHLTERGARYLGANPLNVGLAAFHIGQDSLDTVTSGGGRVYFHDHGLPARISQRGREDVGLLGGRSVSASGEYSPGGLIIAGSDGVFSDATIQAVGKALQSPPVESCAALASLLGDHPIDDSGAIVLTLRLETI